MFSYVVHASSWLSPSHDRNYNVPHGRLGASCCWIDYFVSNAFIALFAIFFTMLDRNES